VSLETLEVHHQTIIVHLQATSSTALCPRCGTPGSRVHSRYERTIADGAFGGRYLVLKLRVRKWICREASCSQHLTASRFPELVQRYARMTDRLLKTLQSIGVTTNGASISGSGSCIERDAAKNTLPNLSDSARAVSLVHSNRKRRRLRDDGLAPLLWLIPICPIWLRDGTRGVTTLPSCTKRLWLRDRRVRNVRSGDNSTRFAKHESALSRNRPSSWTIPLPLEVSLS
jgi:hypothetical protein